MLTETYVKQMTHHWTTTLGQVLADGLTHNWKLFAETMENVIRDNHQGNNNAYVIPMATGESKTQGASMFCSLLPKDIRALIVVYRTDDADLVSETINSLGGYAGAYHSKLNIKPNDTKNFQTLVITHEMFKKHGSKDSDTWKILSEERDLVIIDETLHDITMSTLGQKSLNILKNLATDLQHRRMLSAISAFEKTLNEMTGKEFRCFMPLDEKYRKKVWSKEVIFTANAMNIHDAAQDFVEILESTPLSESLSMKARTMNMASREPIERAKDIEAATVIRDALAVGSFGHSQSKTINVVRQLIPRGVSFVVMDATASVNALYETQSKFKGNVYKVPVKQVRDYSNVIIHTALTKTGKGSITGDEIGKLIKTVPVKEDDEILYVCHKSNEPYLLALLQSSGQQKYHIDHWGNLTGTNKYRDCNKIVLIGLPHKPISVFHAINIFKADEYHAYSESGVSTRRKLQITDMASDVVQAIARIRLRNIVDETGGCLPSEVYLTLNPSSLVKNGIYSALKLQFPGATIVQDWVIPKDLVTQRNETVLEATLAYVDMRLTDIGDDITVIEPRQNLHLDKGNYSKMLRDKSFNENLQQIGVEIQERITKDNRGREHKKPKQFFVRISELNSVA